MISIVLTWTDLSLCLGGWVVSLCWWSKISSWVGWERTTVQHYDDDGRLEEEQFALVLKLGPFDLAIVHNVNRG